MFWEVVWLCLVVLSVIIIRTRALLPSRRARPVTARGKDETSSIGIFLGSGGHTGEMKILLTSIDFSRYQPRSYVVCHGDELSLRAIAQIESSKSEQGVTSKDYTILSLPRARRVAQPPLSTALSTARTILVALWHTFLLPLWRYSSSPWVDVLLINGPGTCVVLVLIAWIRRFVGLSYTRIIYVESFARVKSLSLSGRLVRPFVDTFVIQWPDAAGKPAGKQVTYKGWLV